MLGSSGRLMTVCMVLLRHDRSRKAVYVSDELYRKIDFAQAKSRSVRAYRSACTRQGALAWHRKKRRKADVWRRSAQRPGRQASLSCEGVAPGCIFIRPAALTCTIISRRFSCGKKISRPKGSSAQNLPEDYQIKMNFPGLRPPVSVP